MTRFVVVRHGETVWNAEGRMQGHLDSALNEEGRAQAVLLAGRLADEHFDVLYCSDLLRTRETARPFAERTGMQPALWDALRERHLGVLQGLTSSESAARHPEVYRRFHAREVDFVIPEGESIRMVYERTRKAFEELAARHPDEALLVVTHGGILDMLRRFVRAIPLEQARDFGVFNASINRIVCDAGQWSITQWGDISHLTRDASLDDF
jgi:2,3-bisphosphoglycerate-dependent phosphoglycerate mutase